MQCFKALKTTIGFLILTFSLLINSYAFAENDDLVFGLKKFQPLELAPYNTHLLFWNNEINALSIINGKILHFKEINQKWMELQRFGPYDMNFTTFEIKDLNGDQMPEIIAGTEDPGLIYLYTWDNVQWSLLSYGKHVWSTINKIIIGNFSNVGEQEFLVQNDEGYLFLLKLSNNSLDLVWKSPNTWQPINSAVVADIDNDSFDEVLVVYKTGGIAVLKLENNTVVSIWENFPWGKILGITVGDWDNDSQTEVIFSTSQKMLYILGKNEAQFQYEGQFSDFDCVIEKLAFINNQSSKVLIATDTSGQLRVYKFNSINRKWVEKFTNNTGRIIEVIQPNEEQAILWSSNRNILAVFSYKRIPLKLIFQDNHYQMVPNAIAYNNQIYIAPAAFSDYIGLEISYNELTQTHSVFINERKIEFLEKDPNYVWIEGLTRIMTPTPFLIVENDLYLSLDVFQSFMNLSLSYNLEEQTITIP